MKVLIADQKLVTEIFPMEEAIPTMRRALTMLAEGDVVMSQERDKPPVTGEFYRGEKPFHVYPKKKNSFRSEVRPNGSADDGK